MLQKIIVVLTGLLIAHSSSAGDFTCEKIKDKATRNLCIKDRKAKEAEAEELNAKKKLEDEEKQKNERRKKEIADFVKSAQDDVVANFKDPLSAQFSNMKVKMEEPKALCGKVNGKNSYGGYVGAKDFYAQILGGKFFSTIIEYPKPEKSPEMNAAKLKLYKTELEMLELVCTDAITYP